MLTFEERVWCGNGLQWFVSGLEPDLEPTREFGLVVNTNYHGDGDVGDHDCAHRTAGDDVDNDSDIVDCDGVGNMIILPEALNQVDWLF